MDDSCMTATNTILYISYALVKLINKKPNVNGFVVK